jgi:hypothetical protein
LKFRVFWDVVPYSHVEVTDVSEVHTASNIRVMKKPHVKGYQVILESTVKVKLGLTCGEWMAIR